MPGGSSTLRSVLWDPARPEVLRYRQKRGRERANSGTAAVEAAVAPVVSTRR